jgi:hypothetical protein
MAKGRKKKAKRRGHFRLPAPFKKSFDEAEKAMDEWRADIAKRIAASDARLEKALMPKRKKRKGKR